MKQHVGTKIINAKPMNRLDYNVFRGWELPTDENGSDEGYLVEYVDGGKPNTSEYNGYVSWSPKEQFDNAYKASGNLSFGDAVVYLKQGFKVSRKGWNGKNMYVILMNGYPEGIPANKETAIKHDIEEGSLIKVRPHFALWTAQQDLAGWTPSGSDCLANDWEIV